MDLQKYKGFSFTSYQTESGGYITDAFDDGGSIVIGFGTNEEDSVVDLKTRIDEYEEFFGDHIV